MAYLAHLMGALIIKTGVFLHKVSHMEKEKRQVQLEDDNEDNFLRAKNSANSSSKN